MIKYTFIFEYEGGRYIKQVSALSLKEVVNSWANLIGSEIPKFNKQKRMALLEEAQIQEPTSISGMENVWYIKKILHRIEEHADGALSIKRYKQQLRALIQIRDLGKEFKIAMGTITKFKVCKTCNRLHKCRNKWIL